MKYEVENMEYIYTYHQNHHHHHQVFKKHVEDYKQKNDYK